MIGVVSNRVSQNEYTFIFNKIKVINKNYIDYQFDLDVYYIIAFY